jgi:flavodoxin
LAFSPAFIILFIHLYFNSIADYVLVQETLITTEEKYPADYGEVINYALRENRENSRPALSSHLENMQGYDVVFLGFPNWHFDMPMAIYSFLEEYDFSDKTIVPFCTHGGSRFSSAIRTLEEKLPDAILLDGLAVSERNVTNAQYDVERWLHEIGMLK